MTSAAHRQLDRRLAWGVFALLLVSYAYFYQAGGWNENSHMDLTRALVDRSSINIDGLHRNTGDKSWIGGHYYSDKAPGLSLAAVPGYLLVKPLQSRLSAHSFAVVASYVATLLTVGLATALIGFLLYRASRRLGATPRGSVIAAVSYGLGTTAFPFATQLFSHQLAALLLFAAFWLLWRCRDRYSDARSAGAGLLCAAAVLTEFPAAPVALILFAYHALPDKRWRRLGSFAAGALGPMLLLLVYLTVAFGSPFRTGYSLLSDSGARGEMLGRGVFGLTYPHIGVIVELLIGRFRGLLPYSPVLVLAIAGFALGLGGRGDRCDDSYVHKSARRELTAALSVVGYYVLFVSSYAWWQGGSSFGSRHLLPMLPFLALPLAWVADVRPRITLAAFAVSLAIMTIATSVQPKPSERIRNPFFGSLAPAFFRGQVALGNVCPLLGNTGGRRHKPFLPHAFHDSFNLGMVIGGRGATSLLPLFAIWLSSAFGFWRATRFEPVDADRPG